MMLEVRCGTAMATSVLGDICLLCNEQAGFRVRGYSRRQTVGHFHDVDRTALKTFLERFST
jgi:hypothetical protein